MLTFETIASSSAGNCYIVKSGARAPLLIDPGLPYKQIQKAFWSRGLNICDVAGACLSHAHLDHCKAYKELLGASVDCWASVDTWNTLGMINPPRHCARFLISELRCKIGDWFITPFDAVHDCEGALGLLIDSPEGDRLLYLTDSNYSRFTFPGLTHIAIECNHSMELLKANVASGKIDHERFERTARTHMSLERLIDMLKANDLSRCQEIHLLHLSDQNSDESAFKKAVEAATGIPTKIAPRN